jgi:hypothetical protein
MLTNNCAGAAASSANRTYVPSTVVWYANHLQPSPGHTIHNAMVNATMNALSSLTGRCSRANASSS